MAPPGGITIPSEIITEILYRIPAKSIGRFRCVSKGWLSLLTEPQFIKTHQNIHNQNHLIFSSCNDRSLYSVPFHENYEEEAILSIPTKLRFDLRRDDIYVEGCCNGLVLVSFLERSYSLVVLNPTTGEFVELPDLNNDMEGVDCGFMFGFGYDSVTDDYKVVSLMLLHDRYKNPPNDVFVVVYSLKNNTWKSVSYYPYNFGDGMWLSDASVNGCLHWLATKGSNELPVIVVFSLNEEKFSQMALPNMGNDCKLANLGGKLAVFVGIEGAVWLMNEYGVKESWTKIILHGFNDIPMYPFIFVDHGKILLLSYYQMLIYNLEDGSLCKHVDTTRNLRGFIIKGISVESLVPIPKVKLDESTDSSEDVVSAADGMYHLCGFFICHDG